MINSNVINNVALLSYATPNFEDLQEELVYSASRFGIHQFFTYHRSDIEATSFYQQHRKLLDEQKGAGYWLWKPYQVLDTLNRLQEGDILLYADAGCRLIDNPRPLLKLVNQSPSGILAFDARPEINSTWTKRDAFVLTGCDEPAAWNAVKAIATVFLVRKCKESVAFMQEWLQLCTDPRALTDSTSVLGEELPGYKEHRHDQALFSVLLYKHGIETFRNPSPWGNFLKLPTYRVKGEHISYPYLFNDSVNDYEEQPQLNSPYHTIFEFNRRNVNHYIRQPLHGWAAVKMKLGYLKKDLLTLLHHSR